MIRGLTGRREGELVVDRVRPELVTERFVPLASDASKAAIVASFTKGSRLPRSLNTMLLDLSDHGYHCLLVSASPSRRPLELDPRLEDRVTVLRKPNVGYDFGSWAVGLDWEPRLAGLACVVLTNDSLAGPFCSLGPLLEQFENTGADAFALTDNSQFGRHLQSFFLGFRGGVLREPPLARFWHEIRHESDKQKIILENEIGLSRLLRREGFSVEVAFPYTMVVNEWENPTIKGWERLLDLGFPFVKREIVRRPELAPGGERIPLVLRRRFGIEVEEWI